MPSIPAPGKRWPLGAEIRGVRIPLRVQRKAAKAIRLTKETKNGFIVAAIEKRADELLGARAA